MRNPERIKPAIEKLRAVWETFPQLRLGQLIANLGLSDAEFYNIEDDELVEKIYQFYYDQPVKHEWLDGVSIEEDALNGRR